MFKITARILGMGVVVIASVALLAACQGGLTEQAVQQRIDAAIAALPTPEPGPQGVRGQTGLTGPAGSRGFTGPPGPSASSEVDDLKRALYGFRGASFSASDDIGDIKSDISSLEIKARSLERDISSLERDISSLESKVNTLCSLRPSGSKYLTIC